MDEMSRSLKTFFLVCLLGTAIIISDSSACDSNSSAEIPILRVLNNETITIQAQGQNGNSSYLAYTLLSASCSAEFPVQWKFQRHPYDIQKVSDTFSWNATYSRVASNAFQENQSFVSSLVFVNISVATFRKIDAQCGPVQVPETEADPISCLYATLNSKLQHNASVEDGPEELAGKNCSLDLWFEERSEHFLCKSKDPSSNPKLNFRFCANPTECGLNTAANSSSDCWEHPSTQRDSSASRKSCQLYPTPKKGCSSLKLGNEFPIPKVISCSDLAKNEVKLMGFFHALKKDFNGQPISSYANWENADPADLLSLKSSKARVMANETVDIECSANYYYFAAGLHLSLKKVSESKFSETPIQSQESLETWNMNDDIESIPVRRTLLGANLILEPGDYEVTCYAPVWNQTEWGTQSILISVSNTSLPTFITGNGTVTTPFGPRHNLTCLVRGIPPPTLSWSYASNRIYAVEVKGQSKPFSWSVLTLPESLEGSALEIKCHAENVAGFSEKLFIVTNDESFLVSTKIAASVVLLGFVGNLIVFFFCWKKLFADDEDEEREEIPGKLRIKPTKFVRNLFRKKVASDAENCPHPKCRQKQTQTP